MPHAIAVDGLFSRGLKSHILIVFGRVLTFLSVDVAQLLKEQARLGDDHA